MNDFDPESPQDYTPRFSWWWLVMGVVVLVAMFVDALAVPPLTIVLPKPAPIPHVIVSRFWINQLYAGQPQLTVTQPRDWSNNDAMNVRVPVTGSLSLLGPGLLYLLLRKCGAA